MDILPGDAHLTDPWKLIWTLRKQLTMKQSFHSFLILTALPVVRGGVNQQ